MTSLTYFQADFDRATRKIFVNVNADAGYAIQGARSDYELNAVRRIWNFVGANGISGYASYFAKNTDADTYATAMKTSYPIMFQFDNNRIVIDPNGTPLFDGKRPRYDLGLFDTLSRDSWSADFKSWLVGWLASR